MTQIDPVVQQVMLGCNRTNSKAAQRAAEAFANDPNDLTTVCSLIGASHAPCAIWGLLERGKIDKPQLQSFMVSLWQLCSKWVVDRTLWERLFQEAGFVSDPQCAPPTTSIPVWQAASSGNNPGLVWTTDPNAARQEPGTLICGNASPDRVLAIFGTDVLVSLGSEGSVFWQPC